MSSVIDHSSAESSENRKALAKLIPVPHSQTGLSSKEPKPDCLTESGGAMGIIILQPANSSAVSTAAAGRNFFRILSISIKMYHGDNISVCNSPTFFNIAGIETENRIE